MKTAIVVLALVSLVYSAPQPRKLFHEHFDDFIDIIFDEAGDELHDLSVKYAEFEEFWHSIEYLRTNDFRDLVYEMESLPEFQAVVRFLENDNIDILFFIDILNDMIDIIDTKRRARLQPSGKDFTSYTNDVISLFPKEKLAALYDQKMAEDDEFRVAMENLLSDEWKQTFTALWESERFQAEVQTLMEHGINVHVLLDEVLAVFGQN